MHTDPNGKLRDLTTQTLFSEKDLPASVLIATVMPLYRHSFKFGVWQEDLSVETVIGRLEKNFSGDYRGYFIFDKNEVCIAASWYELIYIEELIQNKGDLLGQFAKDQLSLNNLWRIIWYAETQVDPSYSGQGLATKLKKMTDSDIAQLSQKTSGVLVTTRMRDDNLGIITINSKLGYQRTGIRMPCTLEPTISHEYWYKIY